MKTRRRLKRPEKLNLVPILDSVFIFIFFLLMSAQFVDVYEIGSSVPMTQEVTKNDEKDPLNLTLEVSKEKIIVKSGFRSLKTKEFTIEKSDNLRIYLGELKSKYPKENTIIFKAEKKLPFQTLIKAIDASRAPAGSTEKLFENIVFDNKGDL